MSNKEPGYVYILTNPSFRVLKNVIIKEKWRNTKFQEETPFE